MNITCLVLKRWRLKSKENQLIKVNNTRLTPLKPIRNVLYACYFWCACHRFKTRQVMFAKIIYEKAYSINLCEYISGNISPTLLFEDICKNCNSHSYFSLWFHHWPVYKAPESSVISFQSGMKWNSWKYLAYFEVPEPNPSPPAIMNGCFWSSIPKPLAIILMMDDLPIDCPWLLITAYFDSAEIKFKI